MMNAVERLRVDETDTRRPCVLYELAVNAYLTLHAQPGRANIGGVDVREWHLVQIYVTSMFASRVVPRQQLAALHAGRMLRSTDGTSPLLGVDHVEVLLPERVVVTGVLDSKYTEKARLPFPNACKTVHYAQINGLPTTIVSNVEEVDGDLQTALDENKQLKMKTLALETLAPPPASTTTAPPPTVFVRRAYQVAVFDETHASMAAGDCDTLLCSLPSAWGKTHLVIETAEKAFETCETCVVLVTQVDLARSIIEKAKMHASLSISFEDYTSAKEVDLRAKLRDPSHLVRLGRRRTVPIVFQQTFGKNCAHLDLSRTIVIADEVHKCCDLVSDMPAQLWIGLSAKRDAHLFRCFDKVLAPSVEDEKEMRRVAVSEYVVVRFDTLRDSACDTYDDVVAAIDARISTDVEDVAARIVDAYNYSPFRQAVVACTDMEVQLRAFDALRDKMHEHMLVSNPGAYACEFKQVHDPPPGDAHRIRSEKLVARLKKASDAKRTRLRFDAEDVVGLDMDNASKDSVILVNGKWWTTSGFEVVRQDSLAQSEHGFFQLSDMLANDRSGILLTKQQFKEGHDYPLLRHLILPSNVPDPHMLYQLFMRVARGPEYSMVTLTGGTRLETVMHMLEAYDPSGDFFRIERFENVPLRELAVRTTADWTAVATRKAKTARLLKKNPNAVPCPTILDDTVAYLHRHHRGARPTTKILKIPYSVAWETQLKAAIEECTNTDRKRIKLLAELEWLDLAGEGGPLTLPAAFFATEPLVYATARDGAKYPRHDSLERAVRTVVDHYAARGERLPRGMHVVRRSGECDKLVPVHLIGTIHRLVRAAADQYALPAYEIPSAILDASVRRIDVPNSKQKIEMPHLGARAHQLYVDYLARFEPILRATELRPALYDLNCAFQTTHENVLKSVLPMHKWSLGYAVMMKYSSGGRKEKNQLGEKPQNVRIKIDDFGIHSNVFDVQRHFARLEVEGLEQNHNTLNHKLSKLFYVQLIVFEVLLPLCRTSTIEHENGRPSYPLLKELYKLCARHKGVVVKEARPREGTGAHAEAPTKRRHTEAGVSPSSLTARGEEGETP